MTTQWVNSWSSSLDTGSAAGLPIIGSLTGSVISAGRVDEPWPAAGNFLTLKVDLSNAPGTGTSYRFQLRVAGADSTVLDVTIADDETSGSASGTVAVTKDQLLRITMTPTGTPAAVTFANIWLEFDPTTADNFVYAGGFASTNVSSVGAPRFAGLLGGVEGVAGVSDGAGVRTIAPFAGTITAFTVALNTAPGAGTSWDFRIMVNGAEDASSALNIANTAVLGAVTGLTIAVAKGDVLGFELKAANGTPASSRGMNFGVVFVPTTAGQFAVAGCDDGGGNSTAAARYALIGKIHSGLDLQTTEAPAQRLFPASLQCQGLSVEVTNAPGDAKQYDFQFRVDGASVNTDFVLTGAATTKGSSDSDVDELTDASVINLSVTPTGTPANQGAFNYSLAFGPAAGGASPGGGGSGDYAAMKHFWWIS